MNIPHAPEPAISILNEEPRGKSDAVAIHPPGEQAHGHHAGDFGRIFTKVWEAISRHTAIV